MFINSLSSFKYISLHSQPLALFSIEDLLSCGQHIPELDEFGIRHSTISTKHLIYTCCFTKTQFNSIKQSIYLWVYQYSGNCWRKCTADYLGTMWQKTLDTFLKNFNNNAIYLKFANTGRTLGHERKKFFYKCTKSIQEKKK